MAKLQWRERGGPRVSPPELAGFGSRLLVRALGGEIGGDVALRYPPAGLVFELTMPIHAVGVQFEEAIWAVGELRRHGRHLADLSLGINGEDSQDVPFHEPAFMVERAARVRREVGLPVGVSWNLGVPAVADRAIREHLIDLVMLGRPALANPHWPFYAARELGHADPLAMLPEDWSWWLRRIPGPEGSQGWPPPR